MKKKSIIIIAILVIIIITLLCYIIISSNKSDKIWCNTGKPFDVNVITGEIIEISNSSHAENQTGNILIKKNNGDGDIQVHHNSDIKFKVGQEIIITHGGLVKESLTPQVIAICIKITK